MFSVLCIARIDGGDVCLYLGKDGKMHKWDPDFSPRTYASPKSPKMIADMKLWFSFSRARMAKYAVAEVYKVDDSYYIKRIAVDSTELNKSKPEVQRDFNRKIQKAKLKPKGVRNGN